MEIKNIRKQLGYTQQEFGELIDGANNSLVSKWENGTITPNTKLQKLIAELAGLDVDDLFIHNTDYDDYSESYNPNKSIDMRYYLNLLEEYFADSVEKANKLGEPYTSKFKSIDLNSLKEKLTETISSLPPILQIDAESDFFVGTLEEYQEENNEDYIETLIQDIIREQMHAVKKQTPGSDAEVLYNTKQEIIRVEELIRSYYVDEYNKKYENDDLSLEMYENISTVLKDTIFNLVRLEEYI